MTNSNDDIPTTELLAEASAVIIRPGDKLLLAIYVRSHQRFLAEEVTLGGGGL